ncbi:MAG: STAS domain-containing protein [Planctomycetota bacterium]
MRIEEEAFGDVTVVAFIGEFDLHTLSGASEKFDHLVRTLRHRLVFNIGGLEFISSSALSFFIDAVKRIKLLRGELVLSEPTRLFTKTVRSLGIEDFFTAFPNNREAIEYLRESGEDDSESKAPSQ